MSQTSRHSNSKPQRLSRLLRDELRRTIALWTLDNNIANDIKRHEMEKLIYNNFHGTGGVPVAQVQLLIDGVGPYADLYEKEVVQGITFLKLKTYISRIGATCIAGQDINRTVLEQVSFTHDSLVTGRALYESAMVGYKHYRIASEYAQNLLNDDGMPLDPCKSLHDILSEILKYMYAYVMKSKMDEGDNATVPDNVKNSSLANNNDEDIPAGWFFHGWISFLLWGPFVPRYQRLSVCKVGSNLSNDRRDPKERAAIGSSIGGGASLKDRRDPKERTTIGSSISSSASWMSVVPKLVSTQQHNHIINGIITPNSKRNTLSETSINVSTPTDAIKTTPAQKNESLQEQTPSATTHQPIPATEEPHCSTRKRQMCDNLKQTPSATTHQPIPATDEPHCPTRKRQRCDTSNRSSFLVLSMHQRALTEALERAERNAIRKCPKYDEMHPAWRRVDDLENEADELRKEMKEFVERSEMKNTPSDIASGAVCNANANESIYPVGKERDSCDRSIVENSTLSSKKHKIDHRNGSNSGSGATSTPNVVISISFPSSPTSKTSAITL